MYPFKIFILNFLSAWLVTPNIFYSALENLNSCIYSHDIHIINLYECIKRAQEFFINHAEQKNIRLLKVSNL